VDAAGASSSSSSLLKRAKQMQKTIVVIIMVRLVRANDKSRNKFVGEAVKVTAVELLTGAAAEVGLWMGY
jgi:hypothetical protein